MLQDSVDDIVYRREAIALLSSHSRTYNVPFPVRVALKTLQVCLDIQDSRD
jgi:hypothetical protein